MSYIEQLTRAVKIEAANLKVDPARLVGNRLWARVPGHGELRKARAIIIATIDARWTKHDLPYHPKPSSWSVVFGISESSIKAARNEGRQLIASGVVSVDRALTISEIQVVALRLIVACGVPNTKCALNAKSGAPSRDARCLAARKFAARSLRYEWECLGLPQRPSIPQIAYALDLGVSNVRDYIVSSERAFQGEAA